MASSADPTSLTEPLPAHLKALLKLNEEAVTSSWKEDWHFYSMAMMATGWGFFILWQMVGKNENHADALVLFIFLCLGIDVGLHRAAERRAQRRLQLLLEVIRGLQRREDAPPHP